MICAEPTRADAAPRRSAPRGAETPDRSVPLSCHHIDDPLRHHDHLLRRPAIQRPFYRIKRQNGILDLGIWRISGDCDISALLTIDLDRKCDRVLDQKFSLERRPSL